MNLRLLPILPIIWVLLAGMLSAAAWCADPEPPLAGRQAAELLPFRRVFVPADRQADWPRGNIKYLPLEAAEFERLLSIAQNTTLGTQVSVAVRLESARYRARLVGNQLTAGDATLQVVHAAKTPVRLPLQPCGLAIGKAHWAAPGETDDRPRMTALGVGIDGKLELWVERSGQLNFDWSLGGRRDASGTVSFQFEIPPCPTNRLVLDVPENMTPVVEAGQGIVLAAGEGDDGLRRWQIELGGHHRFRLRVMPAGVASGNTKRAVVRESLRYDFSLHGVNVSAKLNIEVAGEPFRKVILALDPPLQLITAKCGNATVGRSIVSAADSPVTRVALTLPRPMANSECVLQLQALAPLVTDRPWRLPRIRTEDTFWQEGRATLAVPPPLLIEQLVPIGCRQTGPLSAPQMGESAEFQYFDPDSTIEILLAYRRTPLQLDTGTRIKLGGGEMTAEVGAVFRTVDTPQFLLEANVTPHWSIDSITSLPPDALSDWSTDLQSDGSRKLTVRLARAALPARPVKLTIGARGLFSVGQALAVAELVPLRFDASADGKRLVTVDALEPYQLKMTHSEELHTIDPRQLDAGDAKLFAEPPRHLVFADDPAAAELRIALESQKPSYTGSVQVEAIADNGTLRENYILSCKPESARVERVIVRFSHRRHEPHWTLGDEDDRQLSPRPWSHEELAAAGFDSAADVWELTLRRPRSEAFVIHGTREIALDKELPISLPSLPEATSGRATLVIRCPGPGSVRIANHGLESIPPEAVPPDRCQTARAAYRYDPLGMTVGPANAGVSVSPADETAMPPAWVWDCHLHSRYEADGTGQHLAAYRLQNSAAGKLRLNLPQNATLSDVRSVWVDGRRVAWRRTAAQGVAGPLAIDLPAGERFPTVSVLFTTHEVQLGIVNSLEPPLPLPPPKFDLPVLARRWTVHLPPGYEAFDPDLRWQPARAPRIGWSRRLLGPLGRAPGTAAFDPLAAEHWSRKASDRALRQETQAKAEQLLQTLGTRAAESNAPTENGGLAWGSLLTAGAVDALPLTLLIDRRAMVRLALTPQTPVRPGSGQNASARGASLLSNANLCLLIHPDAVILTNRTDAALMHAYLEPLPRRTLWWVQPGPLAEQLQLAAGGTPAGMLIPVETWRKQPAEPQPLWPRARLEGHGPSDYDGWTAYRLEFSGKMPVRLKFVHRRSMQMFGWVTFLLAIACGWWRFRDRPIQLASLTGLFGLAALILPEAYVPLASGALLAMLFCLLFRLIRRGRPVGQPSPDSDGSRSVPSTLSIATKLGVVALAAALMSALCGAADGAEPRRESPPMHRVFIPIDDQEQPTGDMVYLPQDFFDRLHRHATEASAQPHGCLITGATYRGVISKDAASERLMVDELKAIFDLQVFGPIARIRIPFLDEKTHRLLNGVLLDGRVIRPQWESDGRVLAIKVPQPGPYRLEVPSQPIKRSGGVSAGFDLAIPRLATSRLELTLPTGAPTVEVPSAAGSIRFEEEPRRLIAELGPTDRLTVLWPDPTGRGAGVSVEELLWLRVHPNSVVIDAKFKFKIPAAEIRQLRLATDPHLRLEHLRGDDPPEPQTRTAPDQPQIITLQWPRPVSGTVVVDARFLLKETSGVGNLRLPKLEALDARATRRWLGVSVDSALSCKNQASEPFEAVAVPDFVAAWGDTQTQPLFACRLPPGETDWNMSAELCEPQIDVVQELAVSIDRDRVEVHFDAELQGVAGYVFQHRLQVPPDLQLKHVSVLEEGVERAARFSQDENGTLIVFLKGLMAGKQKLALRGHLPIADREQIPMPVLQIEAAQLRSSKIAIFRRPSMLVRMGRFEGLIEVEDPMTNASHAQWGRLVHRFLAEGKEPIEATLFLAPNQPEVHAVQVTRLIAEGESFQAVLDCRVQVADGETGLIDEIHLGASAPWNGPYQVTGTPGAVLEVGDSPGKPRPLTVRPSSAIDVEYRFSISSPLELAPGDRPHVPKIELKQLGRVKRLLVLPTSAKGQPITWEIRGLNRAELPDDFTIPALPDSFETYEVVDESYQAILLPSDHLRGSARVRLADVHVAWQADGICNGVATFDLEPGQSTKCPLWLPAGYDLVHVLVAGMPTEPEPVKTDSTDTNKWRVRLASEHLPQRITVLFAGSLPRLPKAGKGRLHAPMLGRLPVEQTLWTVVGPSMFEPGTPILHADEAKAQPPIGPWDHELRRLRNTAASIESALMVAGEDPIETLRWYRLWAGRLVAARAALERQLAQADSGELVRKTEAEVRKIDQQQSQIAKRLKTGNVLARLSAAPPPAADPSELWHWSLDHRPPATRCAFPARVVSLAMTYDRAEGGRWLGGLAAAAGLMALVTLVVFGLRHGTWAALFKQWPGALGVAAGLAWWLWLSPSVLGWGIVAASLLGSLLSPWKRAESASTIISLRSAPR